MTSDWRPAAQRALLLGGLSVAAVAFGLLESGEQSWLLWFPSGESSPVAMFGAMVVFLPWTALTLTYGPAPRRWRIPAMALASLAVLPAAWVLAWAVSGAWQEVGLVGWLVSVATDMTFEETLPSGQTVQRSGASITLRSHLSVGVSWFACATGMLAIPSVRTPCPDCGAPYQHRAIGQLAASSKQPAPRTTEENTERLRADDATRQLSLDLIREVLRLLDSDLDKALERWDHLTPLLVHRYADLRICYVVTVWHCPSCDKAGVRCTRAPGAIIDLDERVPASVAHQLVQAAGRPGFTPE